MPAHHLRSRVIRQRFVAIAALINLAVLVIVGFIHKGTESDTLIAYAMAPNALILLSGIGMVVARRQVHGARGIACDLAAAIVTPALFLLLLAGAIILIKSDGN